MASGVKPHDHVALWATNVPEWVVLQFALAKIGAILVTVNTSLRARELDYLLRQSEVSTLITIRGFKSVDYLEVLGELGLGLFSGPGQAKRDAAAEPIRLDLVIFIGDAGPEALLPYAKLRALASQVDEATLDACAAAVAVDDVINMQYTSGTTGFPKGVMLSSRNIVNNGYWLAQGLAYTSDDRVCLCVPLFHCFGCVIGVLGAYTHAVCLCPVERFEARQVLETIARERCTVVHGVPTMFQAMLEEPGFAGFDLTSLRTGIMAGAPCPESVMRRVIDDMHASEMTIVYGLTEVSPGITLTVRDDTVAHRTQTVGRALPDVEVRIVEPTTKTPVATGERGELQTRGYHVMKGYYDDPEATAAAVDPEGWLSTWDQAEMDADGYVRVTGRIKGCDYQRRRERRPERDRRLLARASGGRRHVRVRHQGRSLG